MKKFFLYFLFPILGLFLLTEAFLRRQPEVQSSVQERRIHCMDDSGLIFLCKEQSKKLSRARAGQWLLTTNRYGERITHPLEMLPDSPLSESNPTVKEVWVIGDSISMGYLLSDPFSPPYQLSQLTGIRTRNLGVDSLGTMGIWIRLKNALDYRAIVPEHIFWIYNVSDYQDDFREAKLLNHALYRMAYRIHFNLAKASYLYALTRMEPQITIASGDQILPEGDATENQRNSKTEDASPESREVRRIADDHPTLLHLKEFAAYIKANKLPLTVLFYPGMLPSGKPDLVDPLRQRSMSLMREEGIDVVDLSEIFVSNDQMYIPGNGHPTEKAASLFASAMAGKLASRYPATFDNGRMLKTLFLRDL
ncbi:MAG: SGNH/GDSL hydrolase family protein [Leptospiraceae bacterium]|nr:SGNH/GDSL hydrolase family protein [Leptospiraceae bacterium]